MSFIKKKFSLDNYTAYDKVLNNQTLQQIKHYKDIIQHAQQEQDNIINQAQIEKQNIIDNANQQAQDILYTAQQTATQNLEQNNSIIEKMLDAANEQVQDILVNSKQRASQEVWDTAKDLLDKLNQTREQFYTHTFELIENTITAIINKLTTELDIQNKMHVLVNQLFEKAKEVEQATLLFSPTDFENLPTLHIPQAWKIEKDITLESGWCRLVGAGGEWKTSIELIKDKFIQALVPNDPSASGDIVE